MKLITAEEIQSMSKNELANFFNNLSEAQARREAREAGFCRTVAGVDLKLDLYSEYAFD